MINQIKQESHEYKKIIIRFQILVCRLGTLNKLSKIKLLIHHLIFHTNTEYYDVYKEHLFKSASDPHPPLIIIKI